MTRSPTLSPAPVAAAIVAAVVIVPWPAGFGSSHAAVANHIAFAFAFGPLALLITALRPAALVCVAGGAWLAISPWILGYATHGPAWAVDAALGAALATAAAQAAHLVAPPQRRRRPRRTTLPATERGGAAR